MEFKLISEVNNRYEININGIIRNSITKQILKPIIRQGYLCISLRKTKSCRQSSSFRIHRLIGIYFIPNPYNKPIINHIDGNKLNNNIDNLEWVTHSENEIHSYRKLGKKTNKPHIGKFNSDNKSSKPVKQIKNGILIKIWPSINEAGRNGYSISHISAVCNKKEKFHKGYIWEY